MTEPQLSGDTAGAPGPGEELRRERERQGLAVTQVASELCLARPQVEALEADDYDSLPPAPFIRGYLRSYARLLGIEAEALVERFNAEQAEAVELTAGGSAVPDRAGGSRAGLVALLVLGLGVGAALGWWVWSERQASLAALGFGDRGGDDGAEAAADDGEEGAPVRIVTPESFDIGASDETQGMEPKPIIIRPELLFPEADSEPSRAAERDAEIEAAFEQAPVDGLSTADELVEEQEALVESDGAGDADDDSGAADGNAAADDPFAGDGDVSAVSEGDLSAAGDRDAATDEGDSADDQRIVGAGLEGPDDLVLQLDGDSWVEVYDEREQRLAYGLYDGDETVRLRGWGPFEVFLGNAGAVTIEFDGEAVEFADFVRANDTARFRVDADGTRGP